MTLPAPYKSIFDKWTNKGIQILAADWTTDLKRHVGARINYQGKLCYGKLAIAEHQDHMVDEPNMLNGLRREVWWSLVIQQLRRKDFYFPFTSPQVIDTNVNQEPFKDAVAWVIMEFIDGVPIVEWEPEKTKRQMTNIEEERFNLLFKAIINSLIALEKVNPHLLNELGLPALPSPPHGMRRWQKRGLLNIKTAVLGNGAFEIKNFWITPGNQLVIIDNELAGWYPKYDHLSYLYHRLYCNTMRPDLARRLLATYVDRTIAHQDHVEVLRKQFFVNFSRLLKPRVLGGWYYDTIRRQLMPWHKKQRLRYELFWSLLRGEYNKLTAFSS